MKFMHLIMTLAIVASSPLLAKEKPEASTRNAKAWGIQTNLEVSSCDPYKIRSAESIRKFAQELCIQLKLKSHSEPIVTHYDDDGDDEERGGYAMVHLIGKALISAHFVNKTNALHLIVLSDKPYSPKAVGEFTKRYFNARDVELEVCARRRV